MPAESNRGLLVEAVTASCAEAEGPIVGVHNGPCLPPKSMLGVVTYCYAKGLLASQEIERKLWKDNAVRASCANDLPTAKTIRRFRRLNRGMIQICLEKTLRRLRRVLAQITLSQTVPDERGKIKPALPLMTTPAPGEGTTILMRKEAVTRIDTASLLDANLADE